MITTRISSLLRHWMWRVGLAVSGGLTVNGEWPVSGGCIVVANHSSHADTAVLLAALPSKAKPVFGAAADYWFAVPVRRIVATSLTGVLPVRGPVRATTPRCWPRSVRRSRPDALSSSTPRGPARPTERRRIPVRRTCDWRANAVCRWFRSH